ncbi:MinD/ParA family protein [Clostridium lundense]|uniref:MinD/ParA family protein n=1 Tax=Clostridium lundense TaxID=319475 RepID=UPI00048779D9|nr:MinD/ParA family protein [Clostridium lundense]
MLDQADRLRKLAKDVDEKVENNNKGVKIITVTSGKGGVGKSNFVVNLAIAIQMKGKKVMIFDADVGMGNDDVLMGFLPKYNVNDIIFNNMNIEDVLIEGPYGVKLLPGGTGLTKVEEITEEKREKFINKIKELNDLDYIIMDTGAGISKSVLGFIACSEDLIIITTPEPTSLTDAYSLLKAVDHFEIKSSAKVIINRTLSFKEGIETYNKFSNTVNNFLNMNLEHLGNLSDDRKLVEAVRKQKPFIISFPNSSVSKEIMSIANKIMGQKEEHTGDGVEGLFKKIFSIFSV